MAAGTQVRIHDGKNWQAAANSGGIRLRRRAGAGEAGFRVNDASIAQRDLIRTGRECEIVITVDGRRKVFGGFIDRPRIQAEAPGHFNIFPRMVDLSHGAAWHMITSLSAPSGMKYTDIIKRFWLAHWIDVDRSGGGVADNAAAHPEEYRPGYDTLASFTNEITQLYLPGWVWWVGHNGANSNGIAKKLFVQPKGHVDKTASVTLTENSIGHQFEVRPAVDPRNLIAVVGDDAPQSDAARPLTVTVRDTNSEKAYGQRD